MPDATRGLVKFLHTKELEMTGTFSLVVNTYHLYLQPGVEVIKKAGGIHKFMNWDKPLLSDSGGFQVFSLIYKNPEMGKVEKDKVIFKSPLDGIKHELSPEKSIQIQFDLGTDMMVCLDDCLPNESSWEKMSISVHRTVEWAKKCRQEYDKQITRRNIENKNKPKLFAVIQGGIFPELREKCAQELLKIGFDGYGFGARPVDESGEFLEDIIRITASLIPDEYPKFALGIGTPEHIQRCFELGWDMFDCVIPTREGRHGKLFFPKKEEKKYDFYETVNIKNTKYKFDFSAINPESNIIELKKYSKSYLHHLFKIKDPLGLRLASLNNLEFYNNLISRLKTPNH